MSTLSQKFGTFILVPKSFYEASKNMSLSARWLFVALRSHADNDTDVSFPSYEQLREETGLSFSTIAIAIRELMATGWMERKKKFNGNNRYTLLYPDSPPKIEGLQKSKASPPKIEGQSSKNQSLTRLTQLDSLNIEFSALATAPADVPSGEDCAAQQAELFPLSGSESENCLIAPPLDITVEPAKAPKAKKAPRRKQSDNYPLILSALSRACQMPIELNAARLGKSAKKLDDFGVEPAKIEGFLKWWKTNDWRKKNMPVPSPENVVTYWGQYADATKPPPVVTGHYEKDNLGYEVWVTEKVQS